MHICTSFLCIYCLKYKLPKVSHHSYTELDTDVYLWSIYSILSILYIESKVELESNPLFVFTNLAKKFDSDTHFYLDPDYVLGSSKQFQQCPLL